jgi:hypothetical protein
MRQVGVAFAACLVASTFAAGQSSDAPGSPKGKKSSSEAVALPAFRAAPPTRVC